MAGGSKRNSRRWTARSVFGALMIFAIAPAVEAQWLPPLGAAPPSEIAQRLRAQGFILAGPLYRRNSVYVVDVSAGPEGRERLIVDAWSGEILQRFVARGGRWRPEFGGEFGEPPGVFGPPPASEFYTAGPAGAPEEPARAKLKPRAAETARQTARVSPATSAQPENAQNGGSNSSPSNVGAPASAPASAAAPPPAAPSRPAEMANPVTATANATSAPPPAKPERPAGVSSTAETNSSAPSSESRQEVRNGAGAVRVDADKPNTDSAVKAEGSGAPRAEKQEAPQAGAAPQARMETEKSEKPKSSAPAQAQSASAAPLPAVGKPSNPAPAAKSGRKSRVNDIPVMPIE